jgi:glycerol-3-phosphate acyltransferase PlsY
VIHPIAGLVIAYLAGSIPAAYIAGRAHGVDLRTVGSGNLGATNVVRTLGWKVGVPVYLFDTLKGYLPVVLLPGATGQPAGGLWAIGYGIAAIVGHVRPIFLLGKGGGKGVATAGGVFLGLAPIPTLVAIALFAIVLKVSGYVSLGSLTAAAALPLAIVALGGRTSPVLVVSIVVAAFVFWTHRANIGRLRRGEEHRFGRPKTVEAQGADR